MDYFDLKGFLLRLSKSTKDNFKITNETIKGEPLKLRLSTSQSEFALLSLKLVEGKVVVNMDFSQDSSKEFKQTVITIVKQLIDEDGK